MVQDMVDADGSWLWRKCETNLPQGILMRIAGVIKPPSDTAGVDNIKWHWTVN